MPGTASSTLICRFNNLPGGCRAGQSCRFKHVTPESEASSSAVDAGVRGGSKIPCRLFIAGNCRFGDKCWFAHDQEVGEPESEELEDGEIQTMVEKGKQKGAVVAAKEEKVTLKEVEKVEPSACMICFDEEPKQYGLLSDCSHSFCLSCIRSWRNAKGKDTEMINSGVIKSCPLCRAQSHFITPSAFFYPDGDARKDATVTSYRAVLKRMPCKHFDKSLSHNGTPSCPFGRDCFYLHLNPDGTEHVFAHSVESFMRESKTRREAAEARRSARHLRELNATLSAFAESLILNAPEVFDEDGNLVDVWGDEDEEDEGDEDEGSDGEWEDWEDRADDMGSGHLWDLY